MFLGWSNEETKQLKKQIEESIQERGCLDYVVAYQTGQPSTKGDFVLSLSKGEEAMKLGDYRSKVKQPQNQEEPDNMKGGKK
jgi:hypothetical protein